MKTNRTLLIAGVLWLAAAAISLAANAQMGTWKLNENKSTFASKARNYTVTYTPASRGRIKLDVRGVDNAGKPVHWTWEGKFDGKPYKVKNNPIADMIAVQMVDDHTNNVTLTKDGKTVAVTTVKVAPDGKSRTVTTTIMDGSGKKKTDKAVYDKM